MLCGKIDCHFSRHPDACGFLCKHNVPDYYKETEEDKKYQHYKDMLTNLSRGFIK